MPALVLSALGSPPRVEQVQVCAPGPGEVRVQVQASGVCHTDLAAVRDARSCPVVLGHEGAGVVESVGPGVTELAVGDPVVINWQPRCGRCRACRSGRAAFCTGVRGTARPRVFLGGVPLAVLLHAGTICPLAVVPVDGAVRVRPDIPRAVAALLGCAVATGLGAVLYSASVRPGDVVVVIGCGGVGLNVVQAARMRSAAVIAVDPNPARLALAEGLGADVCVDPTASDVLAAVSRCGSDRGADHVFEVVGGVPTMELGLRLLGRGGTLTLVGAAPRDASLAFAPRAFMSRQLRIQGCIYGEVEPARDLPLFADWYADGRLVVDALHTRTVDLLDLPQLFADTAPDDGVRTVVDLSGYAPEAPR